MSVKNLDILREGGGFNLKKGERVVTRMDNFFPYGAVYCVDRHSIRAIISEDVKRMASCGLNVIALWPPISWWDEDGSVLREPSFTITDFVMDEAHRYGMKVIPLIIGEMAWYEYAPDWFTSSIDDPWIIKEGRVDIYEHNLNFTHPKIQKQILRFLEKFVGHYKDHPAVYAWDVWDEPHFTSEDPYTLGEFRKWLKGKYGNIEHLNMVWERTFDSWDQVRPQLFCWASVMGELDWWFFCLDYLATMLKAWVDVVKRVDPNHPVIAHPVGSMINMKSANSGVDDWKIAKVVDMLGVSLYPKTGGRLLKEESISTITETLDGIRSAARDKPFLISELQSHFYSGLYLHGSVSPDEVKLWSWLSVACGAKGVIFWMWHPFLRGWQLSGRGLCNLDGSLSERAMAAQEVSSLLSRHLEFFENLKPLPARVAILYSVDSEIAFEVRGRLLKHLIGDENRVKSALHGAYRVLWDSEIPVDFITDEDLIKGFAGKYDALIIPFGFVISQRTGDAIRRYVEEGGVAIADARLGVVDELDYGYREVPGAGLSCVFGCKETTLQPGDESEILVWKPGCSDPVRDNMVCCIPCGIYRQGLEVTNPGAQVIGKFSDGSPAIILNAFGKGKAVLIGASVFSSYSTSRGTALRELIGQVLSEVGVTSFIRTVAGGIPGATHFRCLQSGEAWGIFGFNYSNQKTVTRLELTDWDITTECEELLTSEKVPVLLNGEKKVLDIVIPPKGVRIIKAMSVASDRTC